MTQRLHPIREQTFRMRLKEWRRMSENNGERPPAFLAADALEELLYEVSMLRAELAGAEERGAARERAALAEACEALFAELEGDDSDTEAHGGEHHDDDCPVCQAIAAIQSRLRGEHAPTAAAGAEERGVAKVLAWLRTLSRPAAQTRSLESIIAGIERGEHLAVEG